MTYAISDISARSPDMGDREFAEFVEDIRVNGQLVPIWVRGGEIIDGRKRMAACEQLGIAPKVINLDPLQDADRISRALNLLRTHYSPSQRAMHAQTRANATKGDARRTRGTTHIPINRDVSVVTNAQAASEVGVAESYVQVAKRIARNAAPEVTEAVKRGTLSLTAATEIIKHVPKAEQPAVVLTVVEASKGKSRHSPVREIIAGVGRAMHRPMPKKPDEQFSRALTMVDEGVRVCVTNAPHITNNIHRAAWIRTLHETRTRITHILKALES